MRRAASLAGCAAVLACGGGARRAEVGRRSDTLTVFAAASLTDVFTGLGGQLEADHPGLDVQFNFAGSSALATQVTQGAPADVFASANGAQMAVVADAGLADGERVAIMGGSAGGYTIWQALVHHPGVFKAALCSYGVSNLFTLAADTHKFEERYLDSMIGPLPETRARYHERSPIFFAERIKDPVAIFQGDVDQVVPRAQSDTIVEVLRRRGVPHEYHVYEGEGHGWRKSETIAAYYRAADAFLKQHLLFG